jgi:hypothetical protein
VFWRESPFDLLKGANNTDPVYSPSVIMSTDDGDVDELSLDR